MEKFFGYIGIFCQIVGATIVLFVLGHFLLGAAALVHNFLVSGEISKVDARYKSPVYDHDPDRIAYWTEFEQAWGGHFEPYVHFRRDEFHGKFINTEADGTRRTVKGHPAADSKKVFMFGGSTLWGTGVADDKTIPSIVQALLGDGYDVYNFGDSAYVSTQELNVLLQLLAQGNIPDIVIFYDGVNDGYAGAYSPAIPRDPHNLRLRDGPKKPLVLEIIYRSNYRKLLEMLMRKWKFAAWDEKVAPSIPANSAGTIDAYEAHIRQVTALAREYGFQAYFFWQPNLFSLSRTVEIPFERGVITSSSPTLVASQQAVYQAARERLSGREDENIFFLGNIFDETDEPVYIDWHHLGANGNEIIAREMVRDLAQ